MAKYHKYVFDLENRKLVGDFETMYQNESKENFDTNEKIIADVAKATYDFYTTTEK